MDGFSAALTTLLSGWMKQLFGPGVETPVFGTVTWADLGVMLVFVLLILFLNLLAGGIVRHKLKSAPTAPEKKKLQHHVFGALGKPLYVLIWIYGIYFAATPLLLKLNPNEGLAVLRNLFNKAFDLGLFAVLFWLCFRLTHVLEARLALWASKTDSKFDDLFVPLIGKCLRIVLPVLGVILALPVLGLPPEYAGVLGKGTSILLIVTMAIILFQAVNLGEKAVLLRFDIKAADNLQAGKFTHRFMSSAKWSMPSSACSPSPPS